MSDGPPTLDPGVEAFLRLFFPQYFDPESPQYVDPDVLALLATVANESRPWCLSETEQDMAQAFFTAYLVTFRAETSTGKQSNTAAGPIISEKEGDIAITYASPQAGQTNTMSKRPASDPWDAWNRLYQRCGKGAILTRFGDPCRQIPSESLTTTLASLALRSTLNT